VTSKAQTNDLITHNAQATMGIFETNNRNNQRGMYGSGRLSEQDDIDSDFKPRSEQSMISAAEDFHSHSRRKNDSNNKSTDNNDDSDSDSDSDSISDSISDSDSDSISDSGSISYYSSSDESDDSHYDDHAADKLDATSYTSPTSVSENMIRDSSREDAAESQNRKEHKKGGNSIKGSFLGRLFGGKYRKSKKDASSKSSNKKSSGWDASDLSDGDIEPPDSRDSSVDPDRFEKHPHVLQDDTSFDISIVDDGSRSQSTSVKYVGDVNDDGSQSQSQSNYSIGDDGSTSQMSERLSQKQLQEERRKSYERKLPGVVEERSIEDERSSDDDGYGSCHEAPKGEYKNYKHSLSEEPEAAIPSSRRGVAAPRHSIPEKTPDPPDKKSKKTKASKKQQQKAQTKAQSKTHDSTLTARNHAASSRVDYAGQISSPTRNLTNKLNNEIHRLRTLVDLMMTRMELYERQSECLVEASVEHNREWKVAKLETLKAKRRTKESPTDEQLSNIKSLLIERSMQDQWLRKLEGIQRGYQGRLATTQDQLKTLRYEHIRTTKKIIDLKKGGGSERESPRRTSRTKSGNNRRTSMTESDHTENTPTESMTDEASPNEGPATPKVNNVPMQRWKGDTDGDPSREEIINCDSTETKSVSTLDPEGRKMTSLLEEMIVSWHADGADMSPLSEKPASSKKKKKKDKKKKKNKKKKDGTPSASSTAGVKH